jgi:hypothetical protein
MQAGGEAERRSGSASPARYSAPSVRARSTVARFAVVGIVASGAGHSGLRPLRSPRTIGRSGKPERPIEWCLLANWRQRGHAGPHPVGW